MIDQHFEGYARQMIRLTPFSFLVGGLVAAGLVFGTPVFAQQDNAGQTDVMPAKPKKGAKPVKIKSAHAKAKVSKPKSADKKQQAATDKADAKNGAKPLLVGTYGDWGAYQSTAGKAKTCYALSQPKDRQPAGLQRNPAFMFISRRPGGIKNEISLDVGFPLKEDATNAVAEVGTSHFELVSKGTYAWVKNVAEETVLLDDMRKGAKLVVKVPSKKGRVTTDTYSLTGLQQAWERVQKDCP